MLKQEFNNKRYIYILFCLVKRIKIVHRMRKKQLQSINIEILPLRFVKLLILIDGNQLCLYVMPNTQVQNAVEKKQIFSKIGFCCQSETRVNGIYFYVFFLCFQFLFNYFPFFIPCLNIKKKFYTDWYGLVRYYPRRQQYFCIYVKVLYQCLLLFNFRRNRLSYLIIIFSI